MVEMPYGHNFRYTFVYRCVPWCLLLDQNPIKVVRENPHNAATFTALFTVHSLYTANIIAVKSTGFTCVPFSMVVPLSFWQSITTGSETLHFNCRQISVSKSTIFPLLFDYFAMAYLHIFCS